MDRIKRFGGPGELVLPVLLFVIGALVVGCAAPARPVIMRLDGPYCPGPKLAVDLVRFDAGPSPATTPDLVKVLYPDRAMRMQVDGVATYVCARGVGAATCALERVAPAGYGFEYVGDRLAAVVTPSDGQTVRVRVEFRVVERSDCRR